jgi:hypothetical protein
MLPPDCFANPNTMLSPRPVPGAELLGRKERLENPVAYRERNAGAGIDHLDDDIVAGPSPPTSASMSRA